MQLTLSPSAERTDPVAPAEDLISDHTRALFRRREYLKAVFIALGFVTAIVLALTNAQWFVVGLVVLGSSWGATLTAYSHIDRSAWTAYADEAIAWLRDNGATVRIDGTGISTPPGVRYAGSARKGATESIKLPRAIAISAAVRAVDRTGSPQPIEIVAS